MDTVETRLGAFAHRYTLAIRQWSYTAFLSALSYDRSAEEKQAILTKFYECLENALVNERVNKAYLTFANLHIEKSILAVT